MTIETLVTQPMTIQMEKAKERLKVLEYDLTRIEKKKKQLAVEGDSDDEEDELGETAGIQKEMEELRSANEQREERLQQYEKNKKWNVDNMFHVKEERTVLNPKAGEASFTETGYLPPSDVSDVDIPGWTKKEEENVEASADATAHSAAEDSPASTGADPISSVPDPALMESKIAGASHCTKSIPAATKSVNTAKSSTATKTAAGPSKSPNFQAVDPGAMETYPQFVEKYNEILETFMALPEINMSRDYLLQHADILLQENAANYLLLASLEDEMNQEHEKMKRTTRQSQILTNIAELSKTMKTHPGNVIMPFFSRLEQREHLEEFLKGVKHFQEKIQKRAVVKRAEIDAERAASSKGTVTSGGQSLEDIPVEQRLGPGGLDPLEVIETLPASLVAAFESRDVEKLKRALLQLPPEEAEHHMKRCIDSGLWVAGGAGGEGDDAEDQEDDEEDVDSD
jgi:cell division cycle protein 37